MAHQFLQMEQFVPGDNPAEAWTDWRQQYELFETAVKYHKEEDDTRIALLLSVIGKSSYKDYLTFDFPDLESGHKRTVKEVLDKFDEHYKPYRNVTLATFVFNNIQQKPGQNFDSFVTEIKIQADQCEFGSSYDRNVKDRIIQGIRDHVLRERLLREPDLTLKKALDICKSAEMSKLHSLAMSQSSLSTQVDAISRQKNKKSFGNSAKQQYNTSKQNHSNKNSQNKRPCSRCGSHHVPRNCPAYGKSCHNCNIMNHFSSVCRQPRRQQSKQHQVSTIDCSQEVAFIGSISTSAECDWMQQINVQNHPIRFKLDTGAQVNVLPLSVFKILNDSPPITSTSLKVCTYTGDAIPVVGESVLNCVINNKCYKLKFIIADLDVQPVLSAAACTALNLIHRMDFSAQVSEKCSVNNVNTNISSVKPQSSTVNFSSVNSQSSSVNTNLSTVVPHSSINTHPKLLKIIDEYKDVFEGVGRLPGKYKIVLHENATPVIAASRKIPLALENKLKDELSRMEKNGIIERVTEPTDWVNPIVIVPKKDGSIRVCLDPRPLNKHIKRHHYQIPSQDQLLSKLKNSKVFSLVDAKNAFYHIQLDEESSDLCTFITPFGRFRFLVMPFGLSCAPEVYQMAMDNLFENCPDIDPYFDDILVRGENLDDHCEKLKSVFQIARENGLKLNKDKTKIGVSQLQYLGHIITPEGVSPDPKKVSAISEFPVPSDKQELMRFLGMATYLMKFVPNFSQETSILRDLLKKDTNWLWDSHHNKAFKRVKELLQSSSVLKFFDKDKPIVLSVDASSFGLGGVLLQNRQPVAYTSATLSEAQSRYSQIEKELLAIVHACEHFHYYVFGQHIEIETDHKPLLGLVNKPFQNISPRLQRLLLRLQRYSFKLTHVPGKYLAVADALSRAPLPEHPVSTNDIDNSQLMVSMLVQASQSKLDQIASETQNDIELQSVRHYIENGWPSNKHDVILHAQPYWHCQSELHLENDLICRGQRLVIPHSCRKDILQRLHVGHRGIVSCKNLARQSLYWPGISSQVENMVSHCAICQQNQRLNTKEPLLDRKLAVRPWQKVAIDFFHLSSVTYILIVDYFSKYVELQHLHHTTAPSVINALKTCFARFGIPEEIVADNGPPFDSKEFNKFCTNWDIFFNPSSPGYPRSNGQVERCIQTLKLSLAKALQDNNDLHLVLMEYRNTPMDGLPSPAEILMGRRIRTLIPTLPSQLAPRYDCSAVHKRLHFRQQRQHKYDQHSRPLAPLQKDQKVLFRLNNKWCKGKISKVGPQPRSYIILAENGREYRRNRVHLKIFNSMQSNLNMTAEDLFITPLDKNPAPDAPTIDSPSVTLTQNNPSASHTLQTTRTGRVIKPPERFKDYV